MRSETASRHFALLSLIAVSAAAVVTRLPLLLGEMPYPDGDEAVLGLMALHWIERGELGLFFWGQGYGLAAPEALLVAAAFKLFGFGPAALKISMLPLWAAGVWGLGLALRRFSGERAAWVGLALLLVCPAWAAWSLKPRGGYLTAFVLFSLLLWLAARVRQGTSAGEMDRPQRGPRREAGWFLGLGAVLALIVFAQPVWAPPALPFAALALGSRRGEWRRAGVWCGTGFALAGGLLAWAALGWSGAATLPYSTFRDPLLGLQLLPFRIGRHLSGVYYLNFEMPVPLWTRIAAQLWYALLVAGIGCALLDWVRARRYQPTQAALLSILFTLLFTLPMNNLLFGFRYLLPVSGLLVVLWCDLGARHTKPVPRLHRWIAVPLAVLLLTGALGLAEWRRPLDYDPRLAIMYRADDLNRITATLAAHEARHVYTLDRLLQYGLMFHTREAITVRADQLHDRYPAYAAEVERARGAGEPVALLGPMTHWPRVENAAQKLNLPLHGVARIGTRYFSMRNPPEALLLELGFELAQ